MLQAGAADTAAAQGSSAARAQEITRAATAGPAEFFTGRVRVEPVWPADDHLNASGSTVTLEPGARSAWHTHPAGQRLVVMSGVGLTQEWGKPEQMLRKTAPVPRSACGQTPAVSTNLADPGEPTGPVEPVVGMQATELRLYFHAGPNLWAEAACRSLRQVADGSAEVVQRSRLPR